MKDFLIINLNNCTKEYHEFIKQGLKALRIEEDLNSYLSNKNLNKLPQAFFLIHNSELLGYVFIKGDKSTDHSWLATHNADELNKQASLILLAEGIKVCERCHADHLKELFIYDYNYYLNNESL